MGTLTQLKFMRIVLRFIWVMLLDKRYPGREETLKRQFDEVSTETLELLEELRNF